MGTGAADEKGKVLMAIVFSRDMLFVHVPKTGGSSVTAYLLDVLPSPVYYVVPGPLGRLNREGTIYLPGIPHRPLTAMRDLVRAHGFDFDAFPAIFAVVRNPYDIAVSNYSFHRRVTVPYDLIDEHQAPAPTAENEHQTPAVEAMVAELQPGRVARIDSAGRKRASSLRWEVWRAAARLHRPVDPWEDNDILYVALAPVPKRAASIAQRGQRIPDLAETHDFHDYMLEEQRRSARPWLSRLHDFYHLVGAVPPNLRIVRFERLADGVRAVLREIGITAEADFPRLNRSEHGSSASYYDAETEALVYGQARWLFDQGFYKRLDLATPPS